MLLGANNRLLKQLVLQGGGGGGGSGAKFPLAHPNPCQTEKAVRKLSDKLASPDFRKLLVSAAMCR